MKYKSIYHIALSFLLLSNACSRDKFADMNTNPSNIDTPELSYLFTEGISKTIDDYTSWFYDHAQYLMPWMRATEGGLDGSRRLGTSNSGDLNLIAAYNGASENLIDILNQYSDIRYQVDVIMDKTESSQNQYIKFATYPVQIFAALKVTDFSGSIPYSDAMKGRYTDPIDLTPEYDNQEQLFDEWITELDSTIQVLSNDVIVDGKKVNQSALGSQDFIYDGDWTKWAKFANSLKLKIAVRLLHQNRDKAMKIAEEVANSPVGYLSSTGDDAIWAKGSLDYNFGDNVFPGYGTLNFISFLVDNKDPRVRFYYKKNEFNSMVVQSFIDAGSNTGKDTGPEIPDYIYKYVKTTLDKDGNTIFDGWSGPGEPWVRYYGAPANSSLGNVGDIEDKYWNTERLTITEGDNNKFYAPASTYQVEMVQGQQDFTFPDVIGADAIQEIDDIPHVETLMNSAEVLLYLAEFKTLGANIPTDAASLFESAIKNSVINGDEIAKLNEIPYYKDPYDKKYGKAIKLEDNEIDSLVSQPAYQLSGGKSEQLEKIYIQMHINFMNNPYDQFVTFRRSGVPKYDSTILPLEKLKDGSEFVLPRRFTAGNPEINSINYDNEIKAIEDQGFTPGDNNPNTLNSQRLWYDKGAPDYGMGPNY